MSTDLQRATGAVVVEIEHQFQALLGDQYAPGRTHQDLHDMLVYGVMGARDLPGRPGIVPGGRTPVVAALMNHATRVAVDLMYGPRPWPVKHARTVAQHALQPSTKGCFKGAPALSSVQAANNPYNRRYRAPSVDICSCERQRIRMTATI